MATTAACTLRAFLALDDVTLCDPKRRPDVIRALVHADRVRYALGAALAADARESLGELIEQLQARLRQRAPLP
jgi:hypothetical protein